MSPKVVAIGGAKPVPELIDILSDLLERAKTGDLRDIALCGTLIDGKPLTSVSPTMDIHRLLAAATLLQHRIVSDIAEQAEQ